MSDGNLTLVIEDGAVIEVEGVRMTTSFLKGLLNQPPEQFLFSVARRCAEFHIDTFRTAEEAAKFFVLPDEEGKAP